MDLGKYQAPFLCTIFPTGIPDPLTLDHGTGLWTHADSGSHRAWAGSGLNLPGVRGDCSGEEVGDDDGLPPAQALGARSVRWSLCDA